MTDVISLSIFFIIILATIFIFLIFYQLHQVEKIKEKVRGLANNTLEMTPQEFFEMRNTSFGGRGRPKVALQHDFEGIYILFNKTKNMYYIGQGKKVFSRVNSHFTGKGNGDVYADYKYGSKFSIKMISLKKVDTIL